MHKSSLPLLAVGITLLAADGALATTSDDGPGRGRATTLGSAPWTQWRGPTRDGQVGGTRWPERLSEDRLELLWRVDDLQDSYSGPIVGDDLVFTSETRDEEEEVITAYDRATGELVWTASWPGAMQVPFFAAKNGSWIRSTPAFDGERLYVAGMSDVLVCLDALTGEVAWTADFKERFGTPLPSFGFVCSPLVTDRHVYVQAGASFVKVDKRTGETVWRSLADPGGMMGSAFASPILATLAGQPQLVVQTRTALAGVDPENGDELWSREIPAFRGMNILTPTVHDGAVFTATYGGKARLLRIGAPDDGHEVTQEWENRVQGNMTSPVVIDGHAYLLNRSNRFTCIDLADGEVEWISPPTGDDYWSLVAQGDRILALANTGRLRLLAANPDEYTVVDEREVSEDDTWSHLAVSGDQLFIREQFGLAAWRWR